MFEPRDPPYPELKKTHTLPSVRPTAGPCRPGPHPQPTRVRPHTEVQP